MINYLINHGPEVGCVIAVLVIVFMGYIISDMKKAYRTDITIFDDFHYSDSKYNDGSGSRLTYVIIRLLSNEMDGFLNLWQRSRRSNIRSLLSERIDNFLEVEFSTGEAYPIQSDAVKQAETAVRKDYKEDMADFQVEFCKMRDVLQEAGYVKIGDEWRVKDL